MFEILACAPARFTLRPRCFGAYTHALSCGGGYRERAGEARCFYSVGKLLC